MPIHRVQQGECLSSIAEDYGFLWETIWTHPDNADLKEKRGDPNTLFPGDEVFIPERRKRDEPRATESRHKFKKKANTAKLRLRVMRFEDPIKNTPYKLEIDGQVREGQTDGDGYIEEMIRPQAEKAILHIDDEADPETCEISLGTLDPVSEVRGVQQRLRNLAYACPTHGELDSPTRSALKAFQASVGLSVSGAPDAATKDKLREIHGR